MTGEESSRGTASVSAAAQWGALVWLAYGLLETIRLNILPAMAERVDHPAEPISLVALVVPVYGLVGMLLAAAVAAIVRVTWRVWHNEASARVIAAATLTLAVQIAAVAHPLSSVTWTVFVLTFTSAVLACQLLAAVRTPHSRIVRAATGPWLAGGVLIAFPLVVAEYGVIRGRATVAGMVSAAAVLALWGALVVVLSLRQARRDTMHRTPGLRHWSAALAVYALTLIAGSLSTGSGELASSAAAAGKTKRLILLISMDTVRVDRLSVYGYHRSTSPQLEAFARSATVFENAMAASNRTLPSHASMFTGLYPSRHGAGLKNLPLLPDHDTAAEILVRNGYRTAGLVANYGNLATDTGLAQGFTYWAAYPPLASANRPEAHQLRSIMRLLIGRRVRWNDPYLRADLITEHAIQLLDDAGGGRGLFLFLNYMDAHAPCRPLAPYDTMFPGKDPLLAERIAREAVPRLLGVALTERNIAHLNSQYDGSVRFLDHHLGELFADLKQRELYDDALIMITSDHGEQLGERGQLGHGSSSLHAELVHVPLIVKFPGQRVGRRIRDYVSHVDVLPTILDVERLKIPPYIEGRSLAREIPPRSVFIESYPLPRGEGRSSYAAAVIRDGKKLFKPVSGAPALFDLTADPGERRNLLTTSEHAGRDLLEHLGAWLAAAPPLRAGRPMDDPEHLERLRSLGYVQ